MDSIIAREEDRAGSYYDAACLYSQMDNKQKALEYLEKSLELGYRRFAHIERDQDMDPIRDMEEFKALILKYKQSDDIINDLDNYIDNYIENAKICDDILENEVNQIAENIVFLIAGDISGFLNKIK